MNLKSQLEELYERYKLDLGAYAWVSEVDRWAELVFCLLDECSQAEIRNTREVVNTLRYLQLLKVDELAAVQTLTDDKALFIAYVLRLHGFTEAEARQAVGLITHVAKVVQSEQGGKMQLYMRHHGESIRDNLVGEFLNDSLDKSKLRYAISRWLQNAFSLPISLEHDAVLEFCEKNQASLEDLTRTVDEMDLGLALIDDLLEMDQRATALRATKEQVEEASDGGTKA